jgi:hypothetical protein
MSTIDIVNYLTWGLSIALIAWMVIDTVKVETTYDQQLLVSSVEGEIEKEIISEELHGVGLEPHHQGVVA